MCVFCKLLQEDIFAESAEGLDAPKCCFIDGEALDISLMFVFSKFENDLPA